MKVIQRLEMRIVEFRIGNSFGFWYREITIFLANIPGNKRRRIWKEKNSSNENANAAKNLKSLTIEKVCR